MTRAALLSLLLASFALGDEPQGFVEVRAAWLPGASGDKLQVVERARPTMQVNLSERVKLVTTVEAAVAEGRDTATELARVLEASALKPLLDAAGCQPVTHANQFLHVDGEHDYLDVDRLYLDVYGEKFDLRVGRQALNWGSARFINPTDPFPQVLLTEPWRPRRGVNAVRLLVPLNKSIDVTGVVAANDTFTAVRATGRVRANWKGTDFALVGAYRGDANTGFVGLDIRGTLGVGYWFEGAWVFSGAPHEEFSVGVDYSFPVLQSLVVFAQYSRNGSGALTPDGYQSTVGKLGATSPFTCTTGSLFGTSSTTKVDPFAPFTSARDYVLAGATLSITPEVSVSATALQNLDDGTGLVIPVVTWALLDWLDVSMSASVPYIAWGQGGEFKPRAKDLVVSAPLPDGTVLQANLAGLVPAATITAWSRVSF